jgi:hypothetical protein
MDCPYWIDTSVLSSLPLISRPIQMENTKSKKRTNKIYVYDNTTKGRKHTEKWKKIPIDISTINNILK